MGVRLPKDPIDRANSLVSRSMPRARAYIPGRVPPEIAEIWLASRAALAETYASIEDVNDRLGTLAEDLETTGVVVHLIDEDDEESLVSHLGEAERTCVGYGARTAPPRHPRVDRRR